MLPIALNPVLNPTEKHFHEDGLRTEPSAENSSERHRKEHNEQHECDHCQSEEVEILWPKNLSEDDELPCQDVYHQQWFTTDFNVRSGKQNHEKQIA